MGQTYSVREYVSIGEAWYLSSRYTAKTNDRVTKAVSSKRRQMGWMQELLPFPYGRAGGYLGMQQAGVFDDMLEGCWKECKEGS